MLVQNENADTVVVLRANDEDGFGSQMVRMMHWVVKCQKKGYYFILDEACSLPFRFTSVFKPFWDNRINQKMLEKAQRIYVISYKLNDEPYVVNDERVVYDQYAWNIDRRIDDTQKNRTLGTVNTENVFSVVHQFNDDTQAQVCLLKQSLQLPKYYQAAHIRLGDRARDNFLCSKMCPPRVEEFLEALNPDIKDVYIATDTLKVMKQIKAKDKNGHKFYSLIYENYYPHLKENRWGSFTRSLSHLFTKISGNHSPQTKIETGQESVTRSLLYILTDIDICRNAERFIGSGNSDFSGHIMAIRENRKERRPRLHVRKCGWFEYLVNYLTIYHLYWKIKRIFS